MKKLQLASTVIFLFISLIGFSQFNVSVNSRSKEFVQLDAPTFGEGEVVMVSASGVWTSNEVHATYQGVQHFDGKLMFPDRYALTLVMRVKDGGRTKTYDFSQKKTHEIRFKGGNGKIYFVCNDSNHGGDRNDNGGSVNVNVDLIN